MKVGVGRWQHSHNNLCIAENHLGREWLIYFSKLEMDTFQWVSECTLGNKPKTVLAIEYIVLGPVTYLEQWKGSCKKTLKSLIKFGRCLGRPMNYWLEYSNNELGPTFFLPGAFSNNSNIPIYIYSRQHISDKKKLLFQLSLLLH